MPVDYSRMNQNAYDHLAAEYAQKATVRRDFNRLVIDRFLAEVTTSKDILDIGCAVGLDMDLLQESGCTVTGIEISSTMIRAAKDRNPAATIIEGNFLEYEFDRTFDGIYAQAFLHLFPKETALVVLRKIHATLRPGGVAHLTTSVEADSHEGWAVKHDYQGEQRRYRKHWQPQELREAIEVSGFTVAQYYEIGDPFQKNWMVFLARR